MPKQKNTTTSGIPYPYMPPRGRIRYVGPEDPYMRAAKAFAREHSLEPVMPNASVVVQGGKIVGRGANGSTAHKERECIRVTLGIPTGQGYELCEGCHPKNHSESKAVADALQSIPTLRGAELYLWGHWWCCEPCWDTMLKNNIDTVYLLNDSEILFNKSASGNIVGKQFA